VRKETEKVQLLVVKVKAWQCSACGAVMITTSTGTGKATARRAVGSGKPVERASSTMSDLQRRSMDYWRDHGYLVASVEHRKRFPARGKPKCRTCGHMPMIDIAVDLWNCFDLFAIRTTPPDIVLLQVTSHSNHATRREKILSSGEAYLCKLAGIRILVESWKKVGNRWQLRDEE